MHCGTELASFVYVFDACYGQGTTSKALLMLGGFTLACNSAIPQPSTITKLSPGRLIPLYLWSNVPSASWYLSSLWYSVTYHLPIVLPLEQLISFKQTCIIFKMWLMYIWCQEKTVAGYRKRGERIKVGFCNDDGLDVVDLQSTVLGAVFLVDVYTYMALISKR